MEDIHNDSDSAHSTGSNSSNRKTMEALTTGSQPKSETGVTVKSTKRKNEDEVPGGDKKLMTTPKRPRKVEEPVSGMTTPSNTRKAAPLSERKQIALVMQLSKETGGTSPQPSVSTPSSQHTGSHTTPRSASDRKVNKRNEKGESPLHLAAIRGDIQWMKQLIRAGADINVQDFAGWTALHEACNHGFVNIASLLLRKGAAVNAQGLDNDTPLHDASMNGHPQLVALLLKYGANPDQPNSLGRSPLDIALSNGNDEIIRLLKKETTYPTLSDSEEDTIKSSVSSPESIPAQTEDTAPTKTQATEQTPTVTQDSADIAGIPQYTTVIPTPGPSQEDETVVDVATASNDTTDTEALDKNTEITPANETEPITTDLEPTKATSPTTTADKETTEHTPPASPGVPLLKTAARISLDFAPLVVEKEAAVSISEAEQNRMSETNTEKSEASSHTADESTRLQAPVLEHSTASCDSTASTLEGDAIPTESSIPAPWNKGEIVGSSDKSRSETESPMDVGTEAEPTTTAEPEATSSKTDIDKDSGNETTPPTEPESSLPEGRPASTTVDDSIDQKVEDMDTSHNPTEIAPGEKGPSPGPSLGQKLMDTIESKLIRDPEPQVHSLQSSNASDKSSSSRMRAGSLSKKKKTPSTETPAPTDGDNSKDSSESQSSSRSTRTRSKQQQQQPNLGTQQLEQIDSTDSRETRRKSNKDKVPELRNLPVDKVKPGSPKVPPLTIKLHAKTPSSTASTTPPDDQSMLNITGDLPYVVLQEKERAAASAAVKDMIGDSITLPADEQTTVPLSEPKETSTSSSPVNVTALLAPVATTSSASSTCSAPSTSGVSTRRTLRSHTNQQNKNQIDKLEDHVPPRKRKRPKQEPPAPSPAPSIPIPAPTGPTSITNPFRVFKQLRETMCKKRQAMLTVTPKPPPGYDSYLMVTKKYLLESNASTNASKLSIPLLPPPSSLSGKMRALFIKQEQERYKLRQQHLVEKEKLILSAEQETIRVHARGARAQVGQDVPLSVCSVLKDHAACEVYHPIRMRSVNDNSSQAAGEDKYQGDLTKTSNRSHFNNRQLISWLQDVADKFEKLKNELISRHHAEADSLYAVQAMTWEWMLKECGSNDNKAIPKIDDIHVPMVPVNDDIDQLPM